MNCEFRDPEDMAAGLELVQTVRDGLVEQFKAIYQGVKPGAPMMATWKKP